MEMWKGNTMESSWIQKKVIEKVQFNWHLKVKTVWTNIPRGGFLLCICFFLWSLKDNSTCSSLYLITCRSPRGKQNHSTSTPPKPKALSYPFLSFLLKQDKLCILFFSSYTYMSFGTISCRKCLKHPPTWSTADPKRGKQKEEEDDDIGIER